ncbi:MAG TPA: hypothetical protein ENJ91_08565 [Rhodobacteraceae bacterium]|nr:hypothetical protein [Paracoccaceae bacterium]
MSRKPEPLFLARETYRQRRITDAARLLPLVGFLALVLPVMWAARVTSVGVIYLFGIWVLLILVALLLARRLRRIDAQQGGPD